MTVDTQRLVAEFSRLVSIDSPTHAERQMADYLTPTLTELGVAVYEDDAGEGPVPCGNLYGTLSGTLGGPPLLFAVHMDTVEPARGKRAVVQADGRITSAGDTVLGADDCAGIAALIEALRVLRQRRLPHRSIELLFTVAEESYCRGAQKLDFSRIRADEAYVLDLTGPVGDAAHQAPTILAFTATVAGKAAHAGFAPGDGVHAIAAAIAALNGLSQGRVEDDTTVNIGTITGGRSTNIVPDCCTVRGEIRSLSHQKALGWARAIQRRFDAAAGRLGASVEFVVQEQCRAYETPADHAVVRRFAAVCAQLGLTARLSPTFGGSDNNVLARHGITGLVVANAMHRCHSCREYTTVEQLCQITRLTLGLMTHPD